MPLFFKMSEEMKTQDVPTVVITKDSAKPRSTKKYVIIAVSSISAVAIVLTAILVGMYIFTKAQQDIIKYTLNIGKNTKQDVTSDPNENIVQYHVSDPGQEVWVINDFNKDIQVVKVKTDTETTCFVSALNRTRAMDPSKVVKPDIKNITNGDSLTYTKSNTPISDTSFLSKTARDTCKGISVYWVYPHCAGEAPAAQPNTTDIDRHRIKRAYYDNSPSYIYFDTYYNGTQIWCVTGCCRTICACSITYYTYFIGRNRICVWYYYNCPPYVDAKKVYDYCSNGPKGLTCPNRNPAKPPTC